MGDNILGHYKSVFNHYDVIGQQSNRIRWKKTQNKGYYAAQFKVIEVGISGKPVALRSD